MLNHRITIVLTALMVVGVSFGYYSFQTPLWWSVVPAIFYFGLVGLGSAKIHWNFFVDSICKVPNDTGEVAITFDDGPNDDFTHKALELLEKHDAKATFFCIGTRIDKHPNVLKELDKKGHTIGNHSYCHDIKLDMSSVKFVKDDLQKTTNRIDEIVGKKPVLFRPPFGVTNPKIAKAIKQLGLTSIGWNIRSLDTTNDTEEVIFQRLVNIKSGDIVLLHDTSEKSIRVLERLLILLKEKGLRSVTIDQLANIKAYA